ncbi:hypothetical protein ACFX12_034846 [Malus domestica]
MSKHPSEANSGSPLERLVTKKSGKAHFPAKVMPKLVSSASETDSSTKKKETTRAGSCEKSTKSVYGEATEICGFLRSNLLKDMDLCAKFVDGVKGVVGPSSFAKHTIKYRRTTLLAIKQKTVILAVESTFLDQEVIGAYLCNLVGLFLCIYVVFP